MSAETFLAKQSMINNEVINLKYIVWWVFTIVYVPYNECRDQQYQHSEEDFCTFLSGHQLLTKAATVLTSITIDTSAYFWTLCNGNHTARSLLCLAIFTQYHVCEIHSCFALSSSLFFMHCCNQRNEIIQIILYYTVHKWAVYSFWGYHKLCY